MAKLPIHKVGGAVDTSELTAVPGDALSDESFIGSGSDEPQEGNVIRRGSPTYTLPINGTQQLQPGQYTGGTITQSIPTMGAQSIGPGARMITLNTAGKYMTGDITIRPIYNLSTSVIKKGEYVAGVGPGTWEGYVNTDPKMPYYYGAFNGIQSITSFKYKLYDNAGVVTLEKDNIKVNVSNNFHDTAIVFNVPIDLTNLSRLIVRLQNTKSSIHSISLYRNFVSNYIYDNAQSTNLKKNPDLGEQVAGANAIGTGGDYTVNLSGVTGYAYLYLFILAPAVTTNIYMVKFE